MSTISHVAVIGSLNVDLIARVKSLPKAGQTIASDSLIQRFGGKGANQALAAKRHGAAVSMIGCLGQDAYGQAYRTYLKESGVHEDGVISTQRVGTGTALIAVDDRGENMIIVGAGANYELKPAHLREQVEQLKSATVMLIQWEVSQPVILESLKIAQKHKTPVVMNPSPWMDDFPWGKYPLHTLIVNEGEAEVVFGKRTVQKPDSLSDKLADYKIQRLVITRGGQPTYGIDAGKVYETAAIKVKPVDTVGAGDAFAGAYAAGLAMGRSFQKAILYANAAGALATLKPGAQEAIPTLAEVERLLKKQKLI